MGRRDFHSVGLYTGIILNLLSNAKKGKYNPLVYHHINVMDEHCEI